MTYYLIEINKEKSGTPSQGIFLVERTGTTTDIEYLEKAKSQWHGSCASAGANPDLDFWSRTLVDETFQVIAKDISQFEVDVPEGE